MTQNTHNGDPASALLEVLDPEQNNAFHDNYLDVDYDLSKVMFIATANNLGTIPRPLLDRMEIIEVSGYITEEKYEIAKRHLVPKEKDNTGLKNQKLTFNKAAIEKIIEQYTRESGVRQLEKQINKALRKVAVKYATNGELPYDKITPTELEDLLGKPPFYRDIYQGNAYAGVVTGLAWTSVGGEILFIETSLSKGKAGKLTLTGNLGDVMKESAVIALEYVKAHVDLLGIDYRIFDHGWYHHCHQYCLGADTAQGTQEHGNDRRDNATRQGAARGWHQGEDSGCQACRHHGHRDVQGEREGHQRDSGDVPEGRHLPLCREHQGRLELRADRRIG